MTTFITLLNIVPALIKIIVTVEEAFPQSGAGGEKLALVKQILSSTHDSVTELIPSIEKIVAAVVAFANAIGAFKKGE
jgi:hypothetical protein